MRVCFVGDPHLRIHKFSLATQFLTWLNKFIAEQKPDLVVNLGDSLDTHAVIRSEAINELMSHVYHVLDLGIPYVYVTGNHDYYSPKDSKYHAMLPFKNRIPNLHIVDVPQDLFGMTFVPYLADGKAFPRITQPVCVAHQTFLGADYGPVNALEGVDANEINAEVIISGHIHKKHNLGKVVYVGSPYSQDASDANQVKGITIFDTDTFQFSFTQTPMPSWKTLRFEISGATSAGDVHEAIRLATAGQLAHNHFLLEITGLKAEVLAYVESPKYLKLVKGLSIRLKTVFTDKERKMVSINAVSMEQILSEFVSKVYSGSLDKEEVLQRAKEVLQQVKSQAA